MSLDHHLIILQQDLAAEQQVGALNGWDAFAISQARRASIKGHWQAIQEAIVPMQQAIKDLPALPAVEEIRWAQALLTMRNLAFMEIDTTGLESDADVIRFTLVDSDLTVIEDVLIQPASSTLSREASQVNGISQLQLQQQGIDHDTAWSRIRAALAGRYILSYNQPWDVQQLAEMAKRYRLTPVTVIGDDLQQHCKHYYHEYGRSLAFLCLRIGHPLPLPPAQTAVDRARGQVHLLRALASAITAVELPRDGALQPPDTKSALLDDDVSDLDEHPF